jgi:Uma2 family endonuclease
MATATASLIDISAMLPAALTAPGLSEGAFLELCQKFPDAMLEYTPEGTVLIMPPTDPETSERVAELVYQLKAWARVRGGKVMGPDGGFRLPGGSRRSPDAAWFDAGRWLGAQQEGTRFPSFAPDFVIELRLLDDRIGKLREKMAEYIYNGVKLGWLIEPLQRQVTIYRPGQDPEVLAGPASVAGEGPVDGFVLTLEHVFPA